jgi:hypothetical protein
MKMPQVLLQGKVTAASATAVTVTPGTDTWDAKGAGTITTVVINGTGLTGFAVGNWITIRVNG